MPTKVDQRRLRDGAAALRLTEPKTIEEMAAQISDMHDGIAALQSLDDLGSPEANDAAMRDMDTLLRKCESLERKLKKIRPKKGK